MNTLNYPEIPAKKVYTTSKEKEKDTTKVNRTFYQQFHFMRAVLITPLRNSNYIISLTFSINPNNNKLQTNHFDAQINNFKCQFLYSYLHKSKTQ